MSIPKIIHFCWLSGEPYPELVQRCMQSWKERLPDYQFMLWDKNRFDTHSVPWVEQACAVKKWAPASDYIRLYALYNYGGIYLDCDVEVIKAFDNLLNRSYFFGKEHTPDKTENRDSIEAAAFGCEKGNPIVKEAMDYFATHNYLDDKGVLDPMTLPTLLSLVINKFSDSKIEVLPMDYFSPKNTRTLELQMTENTYCIHHFNGSWHSVAQQKYVKLRTILCRTFGEKIGELISLFAIVPINLRYEGFVKTFRKISRKVRMK